MGHIFSVGKRKFKQRKSEIKIEVLVCQYRKLDSDEFPKSAYPVFTQTLKQIVQIKNTKNYSLKTLQIFVGWSFYQFNSYTSSFGAKRSS